MDATLTEEQRVAIKAAYAVVTMARETVGEDEYGGTYFFCTSDEFENELNRLITNDDIAVLAALSGDPS